MKSPRKFYQTIAGIAVITVLILLIPLIAMQFTEEVNWGAGDFIIMGALLFVTGLSYVLVVKMAPNFVYQAAILVAIGTTFLLIWANLAVGLIGSGPNLANLMYMGVIAMALIGVLLSRFKILGMEKAMYFTALALALHATIALLAGMHNYPSSSVTEIVAVDGFFGMLYTVAGLLFGYSDKQASAQ